MDKSGLDHCAMPEAIATWQWNNFLEVQACPGQVVVHINLDETCVKLCPDVQPGAVAVGWHRTKKEAMEREQKADLKARRSALTYVCFVCDDEAVQRSLPQMIIGNERVLPQSVVESLNTGRQDGIFILRQKSSWLNQESMTRIIALLGACLEDFKTNHFFILSMDACPCHCTPLVARACARAGMRLLYVPASMTSLLQPCDTHVFARLKHFISKKIESKRIASPTGEATILDVVSILCEGVSVVVQGTSWLRAFAHTGLRDNQHGLSQGILRKLQWEQAPVIPAQLPSLEQLQKVYRAGAIIPIRDVFKLCLPGAQAGEPALDDSMTSTSRIHPWVGRLRSSSALAPASASASSSRTPCPPPLTAPGAPMRVPQARPLFPTWCPLPATASQGGFQKKPRTT